MFVERRQTVINKIKKEFHHYGLPIPEKNPQIIAVSKKQPISSIRDALRSGHRIFGESQVQEAMKKWPVLRSEYPDIEMHFLGAIQTNKIKLIIDNFDVIQTIDRIVVVEKLLYHHNNGCILPQMFVQVNTGCEVQKSGIFPHELDSFLRQCYKMSEAIKFIGLMCLPPIDAEPAYHFAILKKLARLHNLPYTSMGMSADYPQAALMEADYIRVGQALFGARS